MFYVSSKILCNKFIFLGLLTKFLGLSLGQAQDFEKSPIAQDPTITSQAQDPNASHYTIRRTQFDIERENNIKAQKTRDLLKCPDLDFEQLSRIASRCVKFFDDKGITGTNKTDLVLIILKKPELEAQHSAAAVAGLALLDDRDISARRKARIVSRILKKPALEAQHPAAAVAGLALLNDGNISARRKANIVSRILDNPTLKNQHLAAADGSVVLLDIGNLSDHGKANIVSRILMHKKLEAHFKAAKTAGEALLESTALTEDFKKYIGKKLKEINQR